MDVSMDSVSRFFLIAAGLIVTAGLIMIGFRMSDIGKAENEIARQEIMQYDGRIVAGSDVVNFIKKSLSDCSVGQMPEFEIRVSSGAMTVYRDNSLLKEMTNFSHPSYIKPNARYLGEVYKNSNDVIEAVIFTQQ